MKATKQASAAPRPIAYSYVRFSTPEQLRGDSLRRQTEAAVAWCERNGVRLDTSTTLHDLGKSAFLGNHRRNADRHALAAFLGLVEAGMVARGSYLVIENLDRLSREHIQPALLLALNLLQAGVRIVQLKPAEMVFDDKSDTLPVMMMMMELSRGHGESAIKSERVGAAWSAKKKAAREKGDLITRRLPAWMEEHQGKPRLIPARAAVVRKVFDLAISGYGLTSIVRRLTEEGIPTFGTAEHWVRSYIAHILKDRRALGELQPKMRYGRTPDGPAIPDYFPPVVTEEKWLAARAGAAQRRYKVGRVGDYVNIFSCLLRHAKDGDTMIVTCNKGRRPLNGGPNPLRRILQNKASLEGRGPYSIFTLHAFEPAILSMLAEVSPREILERDDSPDESLALADQVAGVEARIAELEAELLKGDVAALSRVLRQLEDRRRELTARLSEARQQASSPLAGAWDECQSILSALDAAPDQRDARLRLRAAMRRIIDSIWVLVVGRGRVRLCAAQVWFTGGTKCRSYLIANKQTTNTGRVKIEGGWSVRSLAEVAGAGKLDLRKPDHAARLEKALLRIDPADLA